MKKKRKIPLNWELFGPFNRKTRLKTFFIYFWFRYQSTYDGEVEYVPYFARKPFSNKYFSDNLGYGINSVPKMIKTLYDNRLIIKDKENLRYIIPTDFANGEWVYLDYEIIVDLFNAIYKKEVDIDAILCYTYLVKKWNEHIFLKKKNSHANEYVFTYREIMDKIGYSSKTNSNEIAKSIQWLNNNRYIKIEKCHGDNCKYDYNQYHKLIYCLV